jgi:hypothetical protein
VHAGERRRLLGGQPLRCWPIESRRMTAITVNQPSGSREPIRYLGNARATLRHIPVECNILPRSQAGPGDGVSTQNFGYRGRPRRSEVTITNSSEEDTVMRASLRQPVKILKLPNKPSPTRQKPKTCFVSVHGGSRHRQLGVRVTVRGSRPSSAARKPRAQNRNRPWAHGGPIGGSAANFYAPGTIYLPREKIGSIRLP